MSRRIPAPENDVDLLAGWAAEEFISAGRSETDRDAHRARATFYADVVCTLRMVRSGPSRGNPKFAPALARLRDRKGTEQAADEGHFQLDGTGPA